MAWRMVSNVVLDTGAFYFGGCSPELEGVAWVAECMPGFKFVQ